MNRFILAVLLFCGVASANTYIQSNIFFDNVFNTIFPSEVNSFSLQSVSLPEFKTEFKDKVAFIKVKGKAEYKEGHLTGIASLRRDGNCGAPVPRSNGYSLNCSLTFSNLSIDYKAKLKYGKIPSVSIKSKANINNVGLYVEVFAVRGGTSEMTLLNVVRQGFTDVKFTGLGPLNKYTKFLLPEFQSHANAQISNVLHSSFRSALSQAFKHAYITW